jgi:taurine dioxygenase
MRVASTASVGPCRRSLAEAHFSDMILEHCRLGADMVVCAGVQGTIDSRVEPGMPEIMHMTVMAESKLDIVPLTKHIGAEIRGLDLREKPDDATIKAIYQAWLDHIVIIFPDQKLSQEDLIRVTGYFGEQGMPRRPPKFFPKGYAKILPGIMLISNIRENGEPIGALPDGEMMFHHDMIHSELPDKATLLLSVEIPSAGGNTLFASGYAAYDTLDPAVRNRLEGRLAIHHYNYGSTQRGDSKGTEAFGECKHPVFRTHEDTNRKAVYVNRLMTVGVEGIPQDEANQLLNAVFDHAEKPEFVYEHVWRVGDLLLWDNRCSSHARTDFPSSERRLMLRTTVKGAVKPY